MSGSSSGQSDEAGGGSQPEDLIKSATTTSGQGAVVEPALEFSHLRGERLDYVSRNLHFSFIKGSLGGNGLLVFQACFSRATPATARKAPRPTVTAAFSTKLTADPGDKESQRGMDEHQQCHLSFKEKGVYGNIRTTVLCLGCGIPVVNCYACQNGLASFSTDI